MRVSLTLVLTALAGCSEGADHFVMICPTGETCSFSAIDLEERYALQFGSDGICMSSDGRRAYAWKPRVKDGETMCYIADAGLSR